MTKYEISNKKLFLIVLLTLNFVFMFYQTSFFIGNHDWDWVKGTEQILSFSTGLFEARYSKFILNVILYGGQILPILNNMCAFIMLALGMVMLVNYWQIADNCSKIIVSIVPCVMPFILGWMYFPINIIGNFMAIPLIIGGLMLIEKQNIKSYMYASLCFLVALGVYPSVAETILICYLLRQIIDGANIKEMVKKFIPIFTSLVAFKVLIYVLSATGIIYAYHYNIQTPSIKDIILNLPNNLALIVKQFYLTLPFFPLGFKLCGLGIIGLATIKLAQNKNSLILWVLAILSSGFTNILTYNVADTAFMPRINFYGLGFLYTGAIAIILSQRGCYKNFGYLLSIMLLCISINNTIDAQKVWELGKTAELKLATRISSRIEENAKTLPLTPVIAGEYSLRQKYYSDKFDINSPYILERSFVVRHIPSGVYNFYAPNKLFFASSQIRNLKPEIYSFLQTTSTPYPSLNSIYLDDEYAIVLLTQDGINAIQAQLPK
ncbi:MAG: glucosyltransferase domain-containing protein [Alphaproteobacteria bacterium]|nr:glucosyltransferase domain-containing protein [Alphaproteobacteria bacterium]